MVTRSFDILDHQIQVQRFDGRGNDPIFFIILAWNPFLP